MHHFAAIPLLWAICCLTALGNDPVPATTQQVLRNGESVQWPSLAEADFERSNAEAVIIRRVNLAREGAGLGPLKCETSVTQVAQRHAERMASLKILAHELDGQGVGDRLEKAGIQWIQCGENIAQGQTTSDEAFDSWMRSPGHRANILTAEYSRIGVAFADDSTGQKYWTMVLVRVH